jgi:hypothetical protein
MLVAVLNTPFRNRCPSPQAKAQCGLKILQRSNVLALGLLLVMLLSSCSNSRNEELAGMWILRGYEGPTFTEAKATAMAEGQYFLVLGSQQDDYFVQGRVGEYYFRPSQGSRWSFADGRLSLRSAEGRELAFEVESVAQQSLVLRQGDPKSDDSSRLIFRSHDAVLREQPDRGGSPSPHNQR